MQGLDELDELLGEYEERLLQMEKNQRELEKQHGDLCEQRDVFLELSDYLENVPERLGLANQLIRPFYVGRHGFTQPGAEQSGG
jgi:hypothetical protein